MTPIEVRGITPEFVNNELEANLRLARENKYAFQVGLKDLDFDVDPDILKMIDLELPLRSIGQAETALRAGCIRPKTFLEQDDTLHQVLAFDPHPIGFSGFMDCVTHSLALTDQGLFETGRYPAFDSGGGSRYWGWFLHRRLAAPDELAAWQAEEHIETSHLLEKIIGALFTAP